MSLYEQHFYKFSRKEVFNELWKIDVRYSKQTFTQLEYCAARAAHMNM